MALTHSNFIATLQEIVVELSLIFSSFKEIEQETPHTNEKIQLLDERFSEVLGLMNDAIVFVAEARPPADLVGNRLKTSLELMTQIIVEKTRIKKATSLNSSGFTDAISLN